MEKFKLNQADIDVIIPFLFLNEQIIHFDEGIIWIFWLEERELNRICIIFQSIIWRLYVEEQHCWHYSRIFEIELNYSEVVLSFFLW